MCTFHNGLLSSGRMILDDDLQELVLPKAFVDINDKILFQLLSLYLTASLEGL